MVTNVKLSFSYSTNKRYGLKSLDKRSMIETNAYFKYINGSSDTTKNWLEAEQEILQLFK